MSRARRNRLQPVLALTQQNTDFMSQFKHFTETNTSDYDYRTFERELSGKLTKARYKRLMSYCRKNTFTEKCGCEHDCCGHMCGQYMTANITPGKIVIELAQSFNY